MRPYLETHRIVTDEAIYGFRLATDVVSLLPHHEDRQRRLIRCHELARVVERLLRPAADDTRVRREWVVIDGKFGPVDHSWLMYGSAFLDVYAVGRLPMVQLLEPTFGVYPFKAGQERDDIREDVIEELLEEIRRSGFRPLGRRAI